MVEEQVWQAVLEVLRESISEVEFRTWFQSVRPLGIKSGTFVLGVPHTYASEWLRDHYQADIEQAMAELGASTPRVSFEVVPAPAVQEDIFTAAKPGRRAANLNPRYTLERFIVGENNRLAHAAAMAVAESPGRTYNPLFIYGGVGLGKTHLMHAVGHYVAERNPELGVEYISTETFTNDLINAIQENRMMEFRNRYRNVDLLLVDDVQFIAGKDRTMEEFFHTFNALYEANKQLILSSDRPPREIDIESRLRSRFEWGLITDIQPPELETRIAILKMNAESRGVSIPEDVLVLIAEQVTSNIRELEGALLRVIASSSLKGEVPTRPGAARILSEVFAHAASDSQPNLAQIGQLVADHYGVRVADLRDRSRTKEVVVPRQVAMFLIRETTNCSLPEIGQYFGRDHTTVLHGIEKIRSQLVSDSDLAKTVATLRGLLGEIKSG